MGSSGNVRKQIPGCRLRVRSCAAQAVETTEEEVPNGGKQMITVELSEGARPDRAEVAICFDADGLDQILEALSKLREGAGHEHLRTPAWAGYELSEEKQAGEEFSLVNHLRLVRL